MRPPLPEPSLLALARRGRGPTWWPLALALAGVFIVVSELPLNLLNDIWGWPDGPPPDADGWAAAAWLVAFLAVRFAPLALLTVAWAYAYERRGPASLGFVPGRAARRWLRGLLVGGGLFALLTAVLAAAGLVTREGGPGATGGLAALGPALGTLPGWALQGAAEEAVARGWLLQALGVALGPWPAVALSAAAFSVFHLLNEGSGWLPLLNLFLLGLFFGLYALWDGSLWGVCGVHAAWNWVQGNVFGLSVSGAGVPGGAVIDLRSAGRPLLGGGAFGPEGGLAATAVALLAVAVMAALLRRRLATARPDAAFPRARGDGGGA